MSRTRHVSLMVIVSLSLLALSPRFLGNSVAQSGAPEVLLIVKTLANPYFIEMREGVQRAIRPDDKWSLIVRSGNGEGDISTQKQVIESFLSGTPSGSSSKTLAGIIITPAASGPELLPDLRRVSDANVPIAIVDTLIPKDLLLTFGIRRFASIASSNVDGGRKAAEIITTAFPRGAHVLFLGGVPDQATAQDRRRGFIDTLAKMQRSGVAYKLDELTANWNLSQGQSGVNSFLVRGERFDAIFGANDQMALGAANAVDAFYASHADLHKPIIVGFDAIKEAREAVDSGRMRASIAQNPKKMGEIAVEWLRNVGSVNAASDDFVVPVEIYEKH